MGFLNLFYTNFQINNNIFSTESKDTALAFFIIKFQSIKDL